ncbi:hypothetical protein [Methanoculleus sp.]|uniref:hypothetical protein n=2 Tax=unclassified Methanoculleus TaxID=2619537 RepID=UPI00272ED602|nr:hypothetical protein [Methanoculleus sp.]
MVSLNKLKILFLAAAVTVILMFSLTLFGVAWINSNPGYYRYTVTIGDLSNYTGEPVTDIIVPMPMRDGELVFSEEELQYRQFGNWKSVIVVTPYGKMLAFQSVGANLTDIHAEFFKNFDPGELRLTDPQNESLSPLMRGGLNASAGWNSSTRDGSGYTSVLFLPEDLVPLNASATDVAVNLELTVSEGTHHSISGDTFRVSILEHVPPDIRGVIPVNVHAARYEGGGNWVPISEF